MAMKNTTPLVSTLNPNAPLFVPAAFRAVEDFSPEWWNLVQTSPAFRDQWLREKFPGSEEQDIFAEDLEELADLDEFLEYQEQLQEMEAVQESLYFDIDDGQLYIHAPCISSGPSRPLFFIASPPCTVLCSERLVYFSAALLYRFRIHTRVYVFWHW